MAIESLTIIEPRPAPIQYTSLNKVNMAGGVYSPNLSYISVSNNDYTQTPVTAAITSLGGNEYSWAATNILVASKGLNTLVVTAYDSEGGFVIQTCQIYVDYAAPTISKVYPGNNAVNVATNQVIQITFNELLSDNALTACSILPDLSGVWEFGATKNIIVYNYGGYLPAYTAFTITVSTDLQDASADIAVEDIYGMAGNNLASTATFSFTTGSGIGANDPTRRGFQPSEEILEVRGATYDLIDVNSDSFGINPSVFDGYLSSQYSFSGGVYSGGVLESEICNSETLAINPPQLIKTFRYKPFAGEIIAPQEHYDSKGGIVNSFVMQGFQSNLLSFKKRPYQGIIFDFANLSSVNYIPIVLSYGFDNEASGGAIHKLSSRILSITWDNPRDKEDARLHYQIELSRSPSFFKSIAFNSLANTEVFLTADDDVSFIAMTAYGAPAGRGKTRFSCPTELDEGVWYVRLRVGNIRS